MAIGSHHCIERTLRLGWGRLEDGRRFLELVVPGRACWLLWGGARGHGGGRR